MINYPCPLTGLIESHNYDVWWDCTALVHLKSVLQRVVHVDVTVASVYSKQYLPTAKIQYHIRAIRKLCGACVTAFLWAAKNTHLHYIYPTGPAGSCLIQKYLLLPITLDGKPSSHTALAQHSTFCTSHLLGGIAICHPMSTWWNAGNTGSFPRCSWTYSTPPAFFIIQIPLFCLAHWLNVDWMIFPS